MEPRYAKHSQKQFLKKKRYNLIIMPDKYKSVWLSHSSLKDFNSCHRLYYLKNIFKDPSSRRKIGIVSPYLTLGITIHKVIENLKNIKTTEREKEIKENLLNNFEKEWSKYHLKNGGFESEEEENKFFERGRNMIQKIVDDPKELLQKIIPLSYFYEGDMIPNYYISPEENLILCGSIDWIEYLEESDALRIIDFKTGRNDEDVDSFQLPIYYLLLTNLQKENKRSKIYEIKEAAYWYLDHHNKKDGSEHDEFQIISIDEGKLEDIEYAKEKIIKIGKNIKKLREGNDFKCNKEKVEGEGCKHCEEYEKVYRFIEKRELEKKENTKAILLDEEENSVEYVGVSDYNQDMYFIK